MKAVKCRTCGERHALGSCPGQVIDHDPAPKPARDHLATNTTPLAVELLRRKRAKLTTNTAPLTVEHVKATAVEIALGPIDPDPAPMRVSALGTVYVAFRAPTGLLAQVDDIAKRSGDSRSRVLRRLVRIGLKGEQP